MTIQFQEEPVFHGQLREVATPYLGLATVLSLGTGIAAIAVTGWQQSSRKSAEAEEQLSDLERHLKEKEALLESLKLSEPRLEASGLNTFLNEEVQQESAQFFEEEFRTLIEEVKQEPAPQPLAVKLIEAPAVQPLIVTTQPFQAQPVSQQSATVQAATAKFASAQGFLGYERAKGAIQPSVEVASPNSLEVEQLHDQLAKIMTQMASLQVALQGTQPTEHSSEAQPPGSTPLQVVKSWSVNQAAS
ncbi:MULTISPECIES: hypothetical protein [unclassified Coleofasciculus]|uniref:hypothetical protein n=1 Tax=unclassified Coleofasciculus TaxID=2692782 RepID=UPI00187E9FF3|nr:MULTISPECIES: hypothetical protein [unclassified Coleofasciculus]MBE9124835.1 hypothetical protein [Coleofasciculus sp. LEGE 07081]MBE9147740.1 hypothetical protein [Coleofasciculus sp. LEGE 07092]